MRIDIVCKPNSMGPGNETMGNVREALNLLGVEAEVHIFHDLRKMIDNRVYIVPALLIDDQIRIAGRVPGVDEIMKFIIERPRYLQAVSEVA